MKKIKIAHLYYDLMNLYGESGNVKAIMKSIEAANVEYEVHFLTIGDKIDFSKYDFYYMGMGSEENLLLVLEDIIKYSKDIKKSIANNKFFLVTGNALELFGKYIETLDADIKINTLNIFDYYSRETDFRIVGEQLYKFENIPEKIIGFQNRSSTLRNCTNPLFKVIKGTGHEPRSTYEGIRENNFFGSYLLGPLLIRNPYFTDYIVDQLLKSKGIEYKTNSNTMEYTAYNEFIKNFNK